MKRIIGTVALAALLGVVAFAPQASAQCVTGTGTNILLKWDANGFSYETGAAVVNYVSPAGNVLTNLIGVDLFCAPLAGLNPNDPTKEYTMVWSGLGSTGTVLTPFGSSGTKYTTLYTGGSFALYEGPINARGYTNLTVPGPAVALPQYSDGAVILSGPIDSMTTVVTKSSAGNVNGSFRGNYRVTGGTMAGLFCNGHSVKALLNGLWSPISAPAGYSSQNNGKFDGPDCTTPVTPSTWGKIKALYR